VRRTNGKIFVLSVILSTVVGLQLLAGPAARAEATATMAISPVEQTRTQGRLFSVFVTVDTPRTIGAYEFSLRYDPSIVKIVSVVDTGFLGKTGRPVTCFTINLDNLLRFACASSGTTPPGPEGRGMLTRIVFEAASPGVSQLSLRNVVLTTEDGDGIAVTDHDGVARVIAP
jgi:hypothetical protein